ncbi:MAG: hypothetical protein AAFX92_06540 [Pseudomonadota bacterium]
MKPVHIVGLVLFAILCVLVWLAYDQVTVLRGTMYWEFRYLILGVVVFLVLSLVQWVWGKVADRKPTAETDEANAEQIEPGDA